jgi:hypothetical protein
MSHINLARLLVNDIDDGPPTYSKAVVTSLVGLISVGVGMFGRKFYYGDESSTSNKVAPTWLGRVMFIGIGSIFILWGMHYLLFEQ